MKKSPADLSDDEVRQLLGRLVDRDERALRELHEIFARRIYLFAVSRLRDEDAAQTVMIDTLFEVWKHPDRFRGESRFSTWLLGIAKYKAAQRECVQLVFQEGLALAEIASIQKVPEGTVKTRLFHGRKNLRDCVERRTRD